MIDADTALKAIGQLPDSEIDIASAAVQLARVDAPGDGWLAASSHLSDLARRSAERAAAMDHQDLSSRAALLADLLAREYGYFGDRQTYDDPANANLIRVTERRRGLPVALGVIWLHTAGAAGWNCYGVDFPAHFLIALEGQKTRVIIDAFNGGRVLAARDLRRLLRRVEGDQAELRPGLLQPLSTRRVLLRLQNNILTRRLDAGDLVGGLRCTEHMVSIAPGHADLWRQAGSLNHKLDRVAAARDCYAKFLDLVPTGKAADDVRAQLEILRSILN